MDKNIIIVDENDEVIGFKKRKLVNHPHEIYRVSALWITNSKNEVLLAQRSLAEDSDPGAWMMASAGTVEEGETYESNIYKEAEEEIGLTGVIFELGPKIRMHGNRSYFVQWFTVNLDISIDSLALNKSEVTAVKWIPLNELVRDVNENPQNYTEGFAHELKLFI